MSDIARLRSQIAAEYEAAQRALSSPAMVGRHAFLTARTENLSRLIDTLAGQVGIETAAHIYSEVLESIPDVQTEGTSKPCP